MFFYLICESIGFSSVISLFPAAVFPHFCYLHLFNACLPLGSQAGVPHQRTAVLERHAREGLCSVQTAVCQLCKWGLLPSPQSRWAKWRVEGKEHESKTSKSRVSCRMRMWGETLRYWPELHLAQRSAKEPGNKGCKVGHSPALGGLPFTSTMMCPDGPSDFPSSDSFPHFHAH